MRGTRTPTLGVAAALGVALAAGVTPAQAARTTTITIWIDCQGCTIHAVNAKNYYASNGMGPVYWKNATVVDGRAVLRVKTAKTTGMAFEVLDPPYGLQGGSPTVALNRQGSQGSWCWAGTKRSATTLRFSTTRWIDNDTPEAAPEHYNMAVWATPSVRTWRDGVNMHRLRSGGLSQQNYPACESR